MSESVQFRVIYVLACFLNYFYLYKNPILYYKRRKPIFYISHILTFTFIDGHWVLFLKFSSLNTNAAEKFPVTVGNLGHTLCRFFGHTPRPSSCTSKTHKFLTQLSSLHSFQIRSKAKYHLSLRWIHLFTVSAMRKTNSWPTNFGIHGSFKFEA